MKLFPFDALLPKIFWTLRHSIEYFIFTNHQNKKKNRGIYVNHQDVCGRRHQTRKKWSEWRWCLSTRNHVPVIFLSASLEHRMVRLTNEKVNSLKKLRWSVNGNGRHINIYSHIFSGRFLATAGEAASAKTEIWTDVKEQESLAHSTDDYNGMETWEENTRLSIFFQFRPTLVPTQNFYRSFIYWNGALNMQNFPFDSMISVSVFFLYFFFILANPNLLVMLANLHSAINSLLFRRRRKRFAMCLTCVVVENGNWIALSQEGRTHPKGNVETN